MVKLEPIRIGVIGCGHWGPNHIRVFSSLKGAKVVMAADPEKSRRTNLAHTYPDVLFVEDHLEVIESDQVDAVVVATPIETHVRITKAALLANKDVLCEKPVSTKHAQAMSLADLAEKQKAILMVGHIFLFNNGIRHLHRLMQDGTLGATRYLHSERTNLGPIRSAANVVYDLASHDVSIFNYLLDRRPTHVTASGMNYLKDNIEDVAFITLYYPDDVIANCHVSWLHPKKIREMTIVGDRKMATWDDLSQAGPVTLYSKKRGREPYYSDFGDFHLVVKHGDIQVPHVPMKEPLKMQAEEFIEAVRQRKTPLSDGRFAAEVVAVLEAANKSIRSHGKAVQLR